MLASYDATTKRLTVRAGSQSAHSIRDALAFALQMDADQIRVIVPDTGGGFGARNVLYPEFVLTALASKLLGRPVKWTAERTESFLTDTQARDQRVVAELALDKDGLFLGVRARLLWRHGAYLPARSLWVHISFMPPMLSGVSRHRWRCRSRPVHQHGLRARIQRRRSSGDGISARAVGRRSGACFGSRPNCTATSKSDQPRRHAVSQCCRRFVRRLRIRKEPR